MKLGKNMPNAVIKMLDSPSSMSKEELLEGLASVPFVRHQYRWLVSELASLPPTAATTMLAGYCGIRRMTPTRQQRLTEACAIVSAMTPSDLSSLPERIAPTANSSATLPTLAAPSTQGILGVSSKPPTEIEKCR